MNQSALVELAFSEHVAGNYASAEAHYRRALAGDSPPSLAALGLGVLCCQTGRRSEGREYLSLATELDPESADAWSNLGSALREEELFAEASVACRRAIELQQQHPTAWSNLCASEKALKRPISAKEAGLQAVALNPSLAAAWLNLGRAQASLGETEAATDSYERALNAEPGDLANWSAILFHLLNSPAHNGAQIGAAAKAFGDLFPDVPAPSTSGPLRTIGFVSGDLGEHPVGFFLAPLLENLTGIRTILYINQPTEDAQTQRLKEAASDWRSVWGMDLNETADLIRRDQVQVLVDLAGHTYKNRLPLFAIRSAPRQVSWLGWSGPTGLKTMDAILGDPFVTPAEDQPYYREKLVPLEHAFLCANFDHSAPEPSGPADGITFGCFNNPDKITNEALAVWAKILARLPEAKLILKYTGLDGEEVQASMASRMESAGLDRSRVELRGWAPRSEHWKAFDDIDVALDTWPYGGATTTLDALWMGVPVVSLVGDRYVGRMTQSLLHSAGLDEFAVETVEDYVDLAVELAQDRELRAELRQTLRQQLLSSPLADAKSFAQDFQAKISQIWRQNSCRRAA